jgi:hypothetical protein
VLGPGPAGAPPVSAAYNGAYWTRLGPLSDFPAGARARLVEAPDDADLLGLVDSGPGGPAVWRWWGGAWSSISTKGMPAHVVATAVDIHDGEGLVLGEAASGTATPSVEAWRKGALQAPVLGSRKALAEPTFGQATPTPAPVQAIKPARQYAPTPAELPVHGYQYSSQYGRGAPLTGGYTNGASDTWDVVFDGPGPKRIVVDVFVMDTDYDAADLALGLGDPQQNTKAKDFQTTSIGDVPAFAFREPLGDGTVEYWEVAWHVGRLVFAVVDVDYTGAIKLDSLLNVAAVVDAKAH